MDSVHVRWNVINHHSVTVVRTYMYILQDGGLLHCTFYAHHPLKHGIRCNNFLSVYNRTPRKKHIKQ